MVTASAAGAMLVVMIMIVGMRMIMMIMAMVVIVTVMVVRADMGAALRLEGTLNERHSAALPARELSQRRIVLDVKGIVRDLGEAVIAAEVPCEAHEAERVFRLHFQQAFGLGLDLHETAILETQRVAVVDGGFHVEIEMDLGSAIALQMVMTAVAGLMVERHCIDDTVGLHGGLADDGGNAGHGSVS